MNSFRQMKTDSNTSKVVKGLSTQTVITIVLGVLEIVSFSIMSRLLTDKDFGYYAAILAVATVFQSFTETGIGSAIVQTKDLNKNYINSSFSLSFIIGVVIAVALFLSSGLLARSVADESMTIPLRIISVTLFCNCLSSVNISLLQREMQFVKIGIINVISLIVTTVIAVYLAAKGYGYYAIITKGVLTSIITLFLSYAIVGQRFRFVFDFNAYKSIFGFGGWLMAAAVFRNIASQVDRLMMTRLFSVETLGSYNRPKEFISNLTGKCNSIFDSVLFPILSSIQDQKEQLQRSFRTGSFLLNLFAMALSVFFFWNSELLIRVFFGEKWLNVDTLFKILSFYPVLLINGRMGDVFLRSLAMTKQQFFFRVGQLLFAIVFILAGYKLGVEAMAISVMLSYACITIMKITYVTRKMGISLRLVISTLFESYRFALLLLPLYLLSRLILADSFVGGIISLLVFIILILLLFIFLPDLIGKDYKDGVYVYLIGFLKNKVKLLRRK